MVQVSKILLLNVSEILVKHNFIMKDFLKVCTYKCIIRQILLSMYISVNPKQAY